MKMVLVLKVSTSLNQTNNYMLIDYSSRGLMILLLEIHYKRIEVCVHLFMYFLHMSFLKEKSAK